MKKLITFTLFITIALYSYTQQTDLSGPINIEGVLKRDYESYPKGTPIKITNVSKLKKVKSRPNGIYLAATIDSTQFFIPSEYGRILSFQPKTTEEFWMTQYITFSMFDHYDNKGYLFGLRQEMTDEANDYLNSISNVFYKDDYIQDYVRTIFNGITPRKLNNNRSEYPDIDIIQSPNPDAYMLPNGVLLISTGLLSTLDSVEELTAIIVSEMAHYVFDHQLINTTNEISRVRRSEFWRDFFSAVAAGAEVAMYESEQPYVSGGIMITAGIASELLNAKALDRLGMGYTDIQVRQADVVAVEFLKFNNMNPGALSSALTKMKNYYDTENDNYALSEQGDYGNINKRIAEACETADIKNRAYQKTMSGVQTLNAIIQQNSRNYEAAERLAKKNIDNNLATEDDYVIYVKANMNRSNIPEANERNLQLIQKIKTEFDVPNLSLYKLEILLLMRMDKQAKANEVLKEYIGLLTNYKEHAPSNSESEWAGTEINWATKLHRQIELF